MNLSIIIPAFNAEPFIQTNIQKLIDKFNDSEIIVVNDGSFDKTLEQLAIFNNRIKIINHSKNLGKGAAIRHGFDLATGDIIIFTDADLPYGLENIAKLYEQFQTTSSDIVIGYRHRFQDSFLRNVTHSAINIIIRLLFWWDIYDTQCGLKGFKKTFIDKVKDKMCINNFTIDIELLRLAQIHHQKISKLPVVMNTTKNTTTIKLKDVIIMFFDILKIRFNKNYF